jgi:hypothetical protein
MVTAWLVALSTSAGCSDDGLNVQGMSGTGGSTTTSVLTDPSGPASGEGDDQAATAGATGGTNPGADSTGSGSDSPPNDESGTASATTTATGASEGSSGASEGSSGASESTTGEACDPITDDPSGIGALCRGDLDCLPGYTCQPFQGIVFQQTCQILCTMSCECPMGLACLETSDKSGAVWYQCG